jgi:transcriptional accessory protein Tex/SPT6
VTATAILDSLAKEFSAQPAQIQSVLEMTDAGLGAPFIGRFRRSLTGGLSESVIRRVQGRREELEELDRRRGTILRLLEKEPGLGEQELDVVRRCMERFELEDAFVPHRRPEPEVQLAIDRGLEGLADELVAPLPVEERKPPAESAAKVSAAPEEAAPEAASEVVQGTEQSDEPRPEPEPVTDVPIVVAEGSSVDATVTAAEASAPDEAEVSAAAQEEAPTAATPSVEKAPEAEIAPATITKDEAGDADAADANGAADASGALPGPKQDLAGIAGLPVKISITPDLARVCPAYVNPDRGVHTETEALAGAVRILSDRLGRNARLRGYVRTMFRKRGVLKVRPLVDASKAGRHKSLFKLSQPLRQIQGHRLIAVRQAQKDRVLSTLVSLDEKEVLPRVRSLLGKHNRPGFRELLDEIARKSYEVRDGQMD